jgi:opacity protein-like surface antigen
VKREKLMISGTALLSWWSLMATVLPVAYSQPVPVEPVPVQPAPVQRPPIMTPTEAERAREAERLRQAEGARAAEPETIVEHKRVRPSETYLAGFGGYTFGGKFTDVQGTGLLSGANFPDRDLANSGVYGGKLGHYFGDRLDWLGVEMEAYNTTPHVEQQGQIPGSHLRVTTLAFNLIGRLKFGCETKTERTETRTDRDVRYETRYEREFCRLQPYGGVGLGVFFANLSNGGGNSVSDNAVPGLNVLGGLRYFFTERIALFGEYKYNWAAFEFANGPIGGFQADYRISQIVGGLSFHF